jgi:hypothetical protein
MYGLEAYKREIAHGLFPLTNAVPDGIYTTVWAIAQ